jgi:hypothetical protein
MTTLFVLVSAIRDRLAALDEDTDVSVYEGAIKSSYKSRKEAQSIGRVVLQYPKIHQVLQLIGDGQRVAISLPKGESPRRNLTTAYDDLCRTSLVSSSVATSTIGRLLYLRVEGRRADHYPNGKTCGRPELNLPEGRRSAVPYLLSRPSPDRARDRANRGPVGPPGRRNVAVGGFATSGWLTGADPIFFAPLSGRKGPLGRAPYPRTR